MKQKLAIFKALSDETRLRILIILSRRELCVCEIERALSLSQAKVSRHLTVLRNAGLLLDRREGTWIYYRLAPPRDELERALQKCLRVCFNEVTVVRRDLELLKKVLSKGGENICKSKARQNGV